MRAHVKTTSFFCAVVLLGGSLDMCYCVIDLSTVSSVTILFAYLATIVFRCIP